MEAVGPGGRRPPARSRPPHASQGGSTAAAIIMIAAAHYTHSCHRNPHPVDVGTATAIDNHSESTVPDTDVHPTMSDLLAPGGPGCR